MQQTRKRKSLCDIENQENLLKPKIQQTRKRKSLYGIKNHENPLKPKIRRIEKSLHSIKKNKNLFKSKSLPESKIKQIRKNLFKSKIENKNH